MLLTDSLALEGVPNHTKDAPPSLSEVSVSLGPENCPNTKVGININAIE